MSNNSNNQLSASKFNNNNNDDEDVFSSIRTEKSFISTSKKSKVTRLSYKSIRSSSIQSVVNSLASAKSKSTDLVSSFKSINKLDRNQYLRKRFRLVIYWIGLCKYWSKLASKKFERNLQQYISFSLIMNEKNEVKISQETLIKTEMMNFKQAFKQLLANTETYIDDKAREILAKNIKTNQDVEILKHVI
jgi:hypothetical protein